MTLVRQPEPEPAPTRPPPRRAPTAQEPASTRMNRRWDAPIHLRPTPPRPDPASSRASAAPGAPIRSPAPTDERATEPATASAGPGLPPTPPQGPALKRLAEREILEVLRGLREQHPEARRLLAEVASALADLDTLDDLRRIP